MSSNVRDLGCFEGARCSLGRIFCCCSRNHVSFRYSRRLSKVSREGWLSMPFRVVAQGLQEVASGESFRVGLLQNHQQHLMISRHVHHRRAEFHQIMEARCECGAVTFTTPIAHPLKIYICHCVDCRHQASSAFGISAMFPYFALPASNGNVRCFLKKTSRRAAVECFFCGQCGSRLVHGGVAQKYVSVKGGCLEGLSLEMLQQAVHIWTKSAVMEIPPGVARHLEDPPEEPGQEV